MKINSTLPVWDEESAANIPNYAGTEIFITAEIGESGITDGVQSFTVVGLYAEHPSGQPADLSEDMEHKAIETLINKYKASRR